MHFIHILMTVILYRQFEDLYMRESISISIYTDMRKTSVCYDNVKRKQTIEKYLINIKNSLFSKFLHKSRLIHYANIYMISEAYEQEASYTNTIFCRGSEDIDQGWRRTYLVVL